MQGSGPRLQAAVQLRWYWVMIAVKMSLLPRAEPRPGVVGGTARAQAGPGASPRRATPAMAARKREQVCTSFPCGNPPCDKKDTVSGAELIGTKQKLRLYAMPKGSAIYTL